MGALILYNIQPGPLLFLEHPHVAWGLIASMFIGNVMLLILNMPLVKLFAKIIETLSRYLADDRHFRVRGKCPQRQQF
jgi:putative tricarboxylic transport membrane protein